MGKTLPEIIEQLKNAKNASNSKFVGVLTGEDEYIGHVYFDDMSKAEKFMAKPEHEECELHIFEYSTSLKQKPRNVIYVNRYESKEESSVE